MMWLSTKALIAIIVAALLLVFRPVIGAVLPFMLEPVVIYILAGVILASAFVMWLEFKNS